MSNTPLFSIVIPTRNRAYLLRYAIASALNQTFDDFEIIVSNNNSSDDTEKTIMEFGKRVRYIHTDKSLPMPDHWDFALAHATGKYITYLCDDDVIHPELLERVADALGNEACELVTWNAAWYFHPTWNVPEEKNTLEIRGSFSGQANEINSRSDLRDIFAFEYKVRHPKMLNTFCSKKILDQIVRELGRVFVPSCPDYTSGAAMLALTDDYIFIDAPLYIAGSARESIGSSTLYRRGEATNQFASEFDGEDLFARSPLKSSITINYVVDSLLRVKEKMGEKLLDISVDWEKYFIASFNQIRMLEQRGIDVAADQAEFFSVLSQQSEPLQTRVHEAILEWTVPKTDPRRGVLGNLRRASRSLINASPLLSRIESQVRFGSNKENTANLYKQRWPVKFRGEENGFTNIIECLERLDGLLLSSQSQES